MHTSLKVWRFWARRGPAGSRYQKIRVGAKTKGQAEDVARGFGWRGITDTEPQPRKRSHT